MQDKFTVEAGWNQASDRASSAGLSTSAGTRTERYPFKANNGKYLMTKKSGHLYECEEVEENARFYFYLINRDQSCAEGARVRGLQVWQCQAGVQQGHLRDHTG